MQQTRPLSYNAQLKVTVAKYYIPSGRCIQALDYSHHNEDGSVNKVADSLMTAFKTKNGRVVYDGGGISPDISIEPQKYSDILISLASKNWIFKYATKYASTYTSISPAKEFKLSDKEYSDFVLYLNDKDYDYKTQVEETLDKLYEDAEEDHILQPLKSDIEDLKNKIQHHKKEDVINHKEEIRSFLEEEIASRYYYQKGRIESSFKEDPEIKEAIAVLSDASKYQKLLTDTTSGKK